MMGQNKDLHIPFSYVKKKHGIFTDRSIYVPPQDKPICSISPQIDLKTKNISQDKDFLLVSPMRSYPNKRQSSEEEMEGEFEVLIIFCNCNESITHLLFDCHHAKEIWKIVYLLATGLTPQRSISHMLEN